MAILQMITGAIGIIYFSACLMVSCSRKTATAKEERTEDIMRRYVGKRVVIGSDTLTIIDFGTSSRSFVLYPGNVRVDAKIVEGKAFE